MKRRSGDARDCAMAFVPGLKQAKVGLKAFGLRIGGNSNTFFADKESVSGRTSTDLMDSSS